jgi:tol-pal system protein YbgF
MNRKLLADAVPVAVFATLLIVSGCASTRSDSAARARPTAESADMAALRRDNDAMRQDLTQSQRQVEALTKQLATDREEQRKFREMMSTNFDLLEQSVSMTLAKAIDKGPTPPTSGPAAIAPPAPQAAPAQGSVTIPVTSSATATAETRAASLEGKQGSTLGMNKAPMSGHPAGPAQSGTRGTVNTRANRPWVAPAAAAVIIPLQKTDAANAGFQTAGGKPYVDPDLIEPANPKQLTANREAKPLYEKGFVLFGNRQYEQSILVYQNFLSRYPEDIYSDNAQFWIGEAYLRMDRLPEAEEAYRKVLREYAHKSTLEGYKTPDAIYRIGQIYAKRNNDKLARYYLQNVVQRFPDSSAGRRAARDLESGGPLTSRAAGEAASGE